MRVPRTPSFIVFALLAAVAVSAEPAGAPPPLSLHPENPRYFLFRGKPAVLVGSGEHYGAVLNLDFDTTAYLDELAAHRLNHTRLFSGTYRELPDSFGIADNTLAPAPRRYVCPWARSDVPGYLDGGGKFDLTRWDEGYFRRLRGFVRAAGDRGIVVEVNLFCTMYSDELWRASPMNEASNTNGTGRVSAREVYSLKEPALSAAQEAVTRKIVAEVNDLDNLYFEVMNEPYERSGVDPRWEERIIAAITETEGRLGRTHLISVNVPFEEGKVSRSPPAVSILNFHGAAPGAAVAHLGLRKAIGINETGGGHREDAFYRAQGWDLVLSGGALFSHLDFSFGTSHPRGDLVDHRGPGGGSPALRRQLGILRDFIHGLDFTSMAPAASLVRGGLPGGSRVQALARTGRQYAVYLNGGSQASLRLDLPAGTYRAEWVDPIEGGVKKRERIEHAGGEAVLSSPPYREDIALRILRENP